MNMLIGFIIVTIAAIIGAFGSLYLKKGSDKFRISLKMIKNYEFVAGVLLCGIGTILFIPALKFGPVNVIYPMASQIYIWTSILAIYFLKEKIYQKKA